MSSLFGEFIFAFLGTLGFTFIFNVPLRHIPIASFVGGAGWVVFQIADAMGCGVAIACFFGACTVGLTSDIASKVYKEAATIFVIPGVLPLVPGAGTYYTMLAVIEGNLDQAAAKGIETLAMAGAIALGLLVMGTVMQIIRGASKRIKTA
ncbi:MAG: threonine/serine exporter family protein [Firmicutes bacterium]|nr:threonine/serine exporter family protein [Bacillota bacterium]